MKAFLSTFLIFIFKIAISQISYGPYPYSLDTEEQSETIFTVQLNQPNIAALKAEDEITDNYKDIPWRFGAVEDVNIDFFQVASQKTLQDGTKRYRLLINSNDAISININYSSFELAEGTRLFIHNEDFTETIGAFTSENNKDKGDFATTLTKGKSAIVEVLEPQGQKVASNVVISSIVYGYRSLIDKAADFGNAASCNIDINCNEGNLWQNEKRSVVLILKSNNSRWCSGALINNVQQDGKPYILTASHCGLDAASSIFIFNYESANCSPRTDGSLSQSIVGSTLRANNYETDFSLFELSSTPPASYNVFYSGWDATGRTPKNATGIHHARGDVKKIAIDFDTLKSAKYSVATLTNGHWEVSDWDLGTTQTVSSGSPLYNESHRIVGQLHGGRAACGNDEPDFYGKFDKSWDYQSAASKQLKAWLDPNGTNTKVLNGYDPNPAAFDRDIELLNFDGQTYYQCGNPGTRSILLSNRGNDTIFNFELIYTLNNNTPVTVFISDTLLRNEVSTFNLPPIIFNKGINTLSINVGNINTASDQNVINNTLTASVVGFIPNYTVSFEFKTDDYGSELSYIIKDSTNQYTLYNNGSFVNNNGGNVFHYDYCFSPGCYTLNLKDIGNDGYCCGFGQGYTLITMNNGLDTILYETSFASSSKSYKFCITDSTTSLNEFDNKNYFSIFPNPTKDKVEIKLKDSNTIQSILLTDISGRVIYYNEQSPTATVDLQGLKPSIYFLTVTTKNGKQTEKIIKQ